MARACVTTPSLARCLFERFLFLLFVNFAAAGSAFGENKFLQIQEENKLLTYTPSGFDELGDFVKDTEAKRWQIHQMDNIELLMK